MVDNGTFCISKNNKRYGKLNNCRFLCFHRKWIWWRSEPIKTPQEANNIGVYLGATPCVRVSPLYPFAKFNNIKLFGKVNMAETCWMKLSFVKKKSLSIQIFKTLGISEDDNQSIWTKNDCKKWCSSHWERS